MSAISSELKNILIGNTSGIDPARKNNANPKNQVPSTDFQDILSQAELRPELSLSLHAQKRVDERSITMDSTEFAKLKTALQTLENKGGRESLVVTDRAAYIIDVANRKVITAMNKQDLKENVFTKIDSTLFV